MTRRLELMLFGACAVAMAAPTYAQDISYDIPAGDLATVLDAYGRQAAREVVYRVEDVRGARSPGVRGPMSPDAALRALLTGTGFTFERDGSGAVAIVRQRAGANASGPADGGQNAIVVTGSRIRGAPVAAQVITQTQEEMRNAGFSNLGDVARSLPQSFSGGQNPQVGLNTPGLPNQNVNSASSLNLRGLGPDATLTLLNGHRVAYDSAHQAVDISAIPLAAVDRIEIVADGASAIYGSDAVGGVANVILRRDYSGAYTSARFAAATDGGNVQQEYNVVAGTTWSSGGLMAVYAYNENTPIMAGQRSFTQNLFPEYTLYPEQEHHNALATGHQRINDTISLSFDALYSHRTSVTKSPSTETDPYFIRGGYREPTTEAYSIAPRAEIEINPRWRAAAQFVYAGDNTTLNTENYQNGALSSLSPGYYDNTTISAEISADGELLATRAGSIMAAFGGGYRDSRLRSYLATVNAAGTTVANNYDESRESYYGYGEIFVPLIAPESNSPIGDRLSVNISGRYEKYPGVDELFTPKLGVIYRPIADVELKGSWGKSFKTPTLYQQHVRGIAYLDPATNYGGAADQTSIRLSGGNPDLKAERATTYSFTASVEPSGIPGLRVEASYFNVNYRDRITQPAASYAGILLNPAYVELITLNPTPAEIDAAITGLSGGLQNRTDAPFDPATVGSLIDGRFINVSSQKLQGVDVQARYVTGDRETGRITFSIAASYLHSTQQLTGVLPSVDLAGNIFNPPHLKGRVGASWEDTTTTLSAYVGHTGSVTDTRFPDQYDVDGVTTVDVILRHSIESGPLSAFDITASVLNVLNAKPEQIQSTSVSLPQYDATNYSPVGRFVSLTIGRAW